MKRAKILVIDDDESLRRVLEYNLAQEGYAVLTAGSGEVGLDLLRKEGADLVVTDVRMAGMDGLQVMEAVRKQDPNIQVIILTAFGTIEMAVEAMKAGAFHYISKPFNRDELKLTIKKALQLRDLERENVVLRQELQSRIGLDNIIAESPGMKQILEMVERVAPTETTVLILGESGTGKELIARAIHNNSPRAGGAFVAVNCAAWPAVMRWKCWTASPFASGPRCSARGTISRSTVRPAMCTRGTCPSSNLKSFRSSKVS